MKPEPTDDAFIVCSRAAAYVDALKILLGAEPIGDAGKHANAAAAALAKCRRAILDKLSKEPQ